MPSRCSRSSTRSCSWATSASSPTRPDGSRSMLPPGEAKVVGLGPGVHPGRSDGEDRRRAGHARGGAPQLGAVQGGSHRQRSRRAGRAGAPATIELSPLQVRTVAGAGENIFKVLQTLPGVNATSDFDSRISVRGGGPDQNLTIMDGVEIHDPYRLFGLASAFNPETVQNFELTAGGFSPKYGDRLSSILVIDNRAGTTARKLRGTALGQLHRRQRGGRRQDAGPGGRVVARVGAANLLRPHRQQDHRHGAADVRRRAGEGGVGVQPGRASRSSD